MKEVTRFYKCIFLSLSVLAATIGAGAQTLAEAFEKNDTAMAALLIQKGANPNETDKNGTSFLMTACRWGKTERAGFLLQHGARVDSPRSTKGRTPLIIACAYYGSKELCELLIHYGADVNAKADDGTTALMFAAQYWKADVVELLLSKGANARLKSKEGKTAMDYLNMNSVDEDIKKILSKFRIDKEAAYLLLLNALK